MGPGEGVEGVLHIFYEMGMEGGAWAIQDTRFISPPTEAWPHESWSYDGLHILKDGDRLTVFSKGKRRKVLWKGVIRLIPQEWNAWAADGHRIRTRQHRVGRARWDAYFIGAHPALLTRR